MADPKKEEKKASGGAASNAKVSTAGGADAVSV